MFADKKYKNVLFGYAYKKDIAAVVILCPVMMVWWLSDFLGGGGACVQLQLSVCSGMVLGECSFLRRTTTKRLVEPQLRFECPAARAKAGEARPSLCPSVLSYTMRGYSRGR